MTFLIALAACALMPAAAAADGTDPVIMTIGGKDVPRSEFVYSYRKNNAEGVVDKKTPAEYVELFVNYKLKVLAALDAKMDTLQSFRTEFTKYRDQQIKPLLASEADVEAAAYRTWLSTKERIGERGLVKPSHIFLPLAAKATAEEQAKVKLRADSIYAAIKAGADFAEMARAHSLDRATAASGGEMPWIQPGQTVKAFEDVAYSLNVGQVSEPFLSPVGWHIMKMNAKKQFEPFDTLKADIVQFIERRNIRDRIADMKLDSIVKASNGRLTKGALLQHVTDSLSALSLDTRYLIAEYHDGLLLFEIADRNVWTKAQQDKEGLKSYFAAHKSHYDWAEPRFKGMAYHVKTKADLNAVKKSVKKVKFGDWADVLRKTFNPDSVIRIRVEKGIFKRGDNPLIDREAFGDTKAKVKPTEGYPLDAVYGKMLKHGPEDYTDVEGAVIADYQDQLEREWTAELRKRYTYKVDEAVLATVKE